jgi:hypothetical protein
LYGDPQYIEKEMLASIPIKRAADSIGKLLSDSGGAFKLNPQSLAKTPASQ